MDDRVSLRPLCRRERRWRRSLTGTPSRAGSAPNSDLGRGPHPGALLLPCQILHADGDLAARTCRPDDGANVARWVGGGLPSRRKKHGGMHAHAAAVAGSYALPVRTGTSSASRRSASLFPNSLRRPEAECSLPDENGHPPRGGRSPAPRRLPGSPCAAPPSMTKRSDQTRSRPSRRVRGALGGEPARTGRAVSALTARAAAATLDSGCAPV